VAWARCDRCDTHTNVHWLAYKHKGIQYRVGPYCAACRIEKRQELRDTGVTADIYVVGGP
jgi:hypothetical protein